MNAKVVLWRNLLALGSVMALMLISTAQANVIHRSWDERICDADFIGVVECEVAGGIVAEYRVVESWKGAEVGSKMRIRFDTSRESPFITTLCGQRYVVMLNKGPAAGRFSSRTYHGGVPIWARSFPYDYTFSDQGIEYIFPYGAEKRKTPVLGRSNMTLDQFRKAVKSLLDLPEEERELVLLKRFTEKHTRSYINTLERTSKKKELASFVAISKTLRDSGSAKELLETLFATAKTASVGSYWKRLPVFIVRQGGGKVAWSIINTMPEDDFPGTRLQRKWLLLTLGKRAGVKMTIPVKDKTPPKSEDTRPSAKELSTAEEILRKGPYHTDPDEDLIDIFSNDPLKMDFGNAFSMLTLHRPARVADFLCNWVQKEKSFHQNHMDYTLSSDFAILCKTDRAKHLRTLLRAKEPYVRVTGAVYLCFEDEKNGIEALKQLAELEGEPGIWAALNLVRRGHKEAMPLALKAFNRPTYDHMSMSRRFQRTLASRLRILLSNSAKHSNLSQPVPPELRSPLNISDEMYTKQYSKYHDYFVNWWKENKEKVILHDPWLALCKEQKVD